MVKLKGSPEMTPAQLVCEIAAAELADYFEIRHPQHAIVVIEQELVELIALQEPSRANLILASVGTNFGCAALNNLVTWPIDRGLSASQFDDATRIFAFDALIQNPDRRFDNPNLGTVGDRIFIYDHDLAFSFRQDILPNREPWQISSQPFWTDHVFFNQLRKRPLSLESFIERLAAWTPSAFRGLAEALPSDWDCQLLTVISDHIATFAVRSELFKTELMRRLA